jgi:hypothetical protein
VLPENASATGTIRACEQSLKRLHPVTRPSTIGATTLGIFARGSRFS